MGLSDDLLTLAIRVEGGEASEAEILRVQQAMGEVDKQSTELASNFSKPIEHIGLHTLSREIARASGLGGEARGIFMALNAVTAAFGTETAAVLGPVALAIGVVAVAYEKLSKSSKEASKELEDNIAANKDSIKTYQDSLKAIDDYSKAVGSLPEKLKAYQDALKSGLGAAEVQTTHDMGKAMAQLGQEISDNKAKRAGLIADLKEAQASGVLAWKTFHKYSEEIDNLGRTITQQETKFATLKADLPAVAKGHKSAAEAADEHAKALRHLTSALDGTDAGFVTWNREQDEMLEKESKLPKATKQHYDEMQKEAISAAHSMEEAFAHSFANVIQGHDNMRQEIIAQERQMVNEMIKSLIQVAEQAAITKLAVSGIFGDPTVSGSFAAAMAKG